MKNVDKIQKCASNEVKICQFSIFHQMCNYSFSEVALRLSVTKKCLLVYFIEKGFHALIEMLPFIMPAWHSNPLTFVSFGSSQA